MAAALVLPLWILSAAGAVSAQPVRPIQITDFGGYIETGLRNEREDRSRQRGGPDYEFERLEFWEALRLEIEGYGYHPRLLRFGGDVKVELRQELKDSEDAILHQLGGRLRLLPEHHFGLSLWGRTASQDLERRFARNIELETDQFGGTFFLRRGWIPFQLGYRHWTRESEESTELGLDEEGDEIFFRGRYNVGEWPSSGRLELELTDETVQRRPNETIEFFADNITYFDEAQRKKLRGNLRFRDYSGLRDLRTYSGQVEFDWDHTETLFSRTYLDFDRNETAAQTSNFVSPRFTLRHQLYDSLTTEFETYGEFEDASFADTERYGATLRMSYTKLLGQWGLLGINVFPRAELMRLKPREASAFVIDEEVVLNDATAVELRERDILPGTIVVTDEDGTFRFAQDFDYEVITWRGLTEIRSLPGGLIADGETVLVDYSYEISGESEVLTTGIGYGASLNLFQALLLYGRVTSDDQEQISGEIPKELESRKRKTFGAEATWRWVNARVEYESDNTNFGSFESLTEYLSLTTLRKGSWNTHLSGELSTVEFGDTDEELERLVVRAGFRTRVLKRGWLEIAADYRQERWEGDRARGFGNRDDIGLDVGYWWRYKRLEVSLEGELVRTDQEGQRDSSYRLYLRARREF